jgi:vacuolar-type H+-ATPase subunit C/Vma6
MTVPIPTSLDFVSARLHGARSRLAESERLDDLCRLHSLAELSRVLFSEAAAAPTGRGPATAADLQRRLVRRQAADLRQVARWLEGPAGRVAEWLAERYHVENLKVLARGFATRTPLAEVEAHLVRLDGSTAFDARAMIEAETLEAFADLIASKLLRLSVRSVDEAYRAAPKPFLIEAALDRGYFLELQDRVDAVRDEDRDGVWPIVRQEIDLFHLMLVTRGRFQYGLKTEQLLSLRFRGTGLHLDRLAAMLAAADLSDVAARAAGIVTDGAASGADPVALEVLAWQRYLRLATAAFRRNPLALGMVVSYAAIGRVELANLITLSEGIRAGMDADALRRRLIPRSDLAVLLRAGPEAARA